MWEATGWYYVSWLDLSGFPVADIRKCRAGDWRSSKPTPIILQRVRSATSWGQNAEDRSTFIKSTNCHISDERCDSCKYWLLLMFFTGHWLICIAQTKILANACTKIPLRANKPSSCFSFQSRTLRKFPNYRLSPVLVACCPVVKFSAHFSGILFILYKNVSVCINERNLSNIRGHWETKNYIETGQRIILPRLSELNDSKTSY